MQATLSKFVNLNYLAPYRQLFLSITDYLKSILTYESVTLTISLSDEPVGLSKY